MSSRTNHSPPDVRPTVTAFRVGDVFTIWRLDFVEGFLCRELGFGFILGGFRFGRVSSLIDLLRLIGFVAFFVVVFSFVCIGRGGVGCSVGRSVVGYFCAIGRRSIAGCINI